MYYLFFTSEFVLCSYSKRRFKAFFPSSRYFIVFSKPQQRTTARLVLNYDCLFNAVQANSKLFQRLIQP